MWCINPEETIAFMKTVAKPWIAFKVLAAGAIPPAQAFPYAFKNGADFIAVGMFDFQVKADAELAERAIRHHQSGAALAGLRERDDLRLTRRLPRRASAWTSGLRFVIQGVRMFDDIPSLTPGFSPWPVPGQRFRLCPSTMFEVPDDP